MSDPATLEEYNALQQQHAKIDGFGFEVTMTIPCPFCCEPGFCTYFVLKDMEQVMQRENVCKACGRGMVAVFDRQGPHGEQVTMHLYQTCGADPASYLAAMPRAMRQFPVHSDDRRKTPAPHSVPWAWIQQFERQAIENHDQSLEKLASRGGLAWIEIVMIMRSRKLRQMDALKDEIGPTPAHAQAYVLAAVEKWLADRQVKP